MEYFELISEVYDSEANDYIITFNCTEEIIETLKNVYGEDYENKLSADFSAYVRSLKDSE